MRKTIYCKGCHKAVERNVKSSNDAGAFCSRDCSFSHLGLMKMERYFLKRLSYEANKERKAIEKQIRSLVRREVLALKRIGTSIKAATKICALCGNSFLRPRPFVRICSAECRHQFDLASQERQKETNKKFRKKYRKTDKGRQDRRISRAKRRARLRGNRNPKSIDPVKVFERDKWTCHICGGRTIKSKRGTIDPKAPELEHIISLAEGGNHDWGNLACAHRKCNIEKGRNTYGQLAFDIAV